MNCNCKVLDVVKLTNRINTNFACEYSEDDRIFTICESGVYIITLKPMITSCFPTFSGRKDYFQVSNYNVSSSVGIDINNFYPELPRRDLYETVLRTELAANLNHATSIENHPLSAKWSPRGLEGKTDCLLAVLTSTFSLEVYVKLLDENELIEYVVIANLTKDVAEYQKTKWKSSDKLPVQAKFKEYKKRIESISPTAFAWTHIFEINNVLHCCLVIGHMDGSISVWRTNERKYNMRIDSKFICIASYKSELTYITSIHWRHTKTTAGVLSIGDKSGRVSVLSVTKLDETEAVISNECLFWKEADNIKVDQITVLDIESQSFVVIVKQSYLIIYGINEAGVVYDQKIVDVGNLYITGIFHSNNTLYVLTLSGTMKLLTLSTNNNKIDINKQITNLKVDFARLRTHGFFFSKNSVFAGILTTPSRIPELVVEKQLSSLHIIHNCDFDPFKTLMDNPTNSLNDYWDCFEILRLLCLKEKRFPWLGMDRNINYSKLSLLQLKSLRLIAKMSEEVYNVVPQVTIYNIKPYILLHYMVDIKLAVERMNRLLHQRSSGVELTTFQMQSIDVQNFFLKEMIAKDVLAKLNVSENFIDEVDHVMRIANELRYPDMPQCFWCGEKIIGLTCLSQHSDSRCAISMMPITMIPGYKCPLCKCLVHRQIGDEMALVFCPYCDVRMIQRFFQTKFIDDFEKASYQFKEATRSAYGLGDYPEIVSPCFDDCLKEDGQFDVLEENEHDFLILSDSEEGSNADCDELRTLYFNLEGMSLNSNK